MPEKKMNIWAKYGSVPCRYSFFFFAYLVYNLSLEGFHPSKFCVAAIFEWLLRGNQKTSTPVHGTSFPSLVVVAAQVSISGKRLTSRAPAKKKKKTYSEPIS